MTAEIDRARLVGIAERIRRGARHPDVLALCDGVIALAAERNAAPVSIAPANAVSSPANKPRTDRKAYMRDLMRKRRAAKATAEKTTIGATATERGLARLYRAARRATAEQSVLYSIVCRDAPDARDVRLGRVRDARGVPIAPSDAFGTYPISLFLELR
jgi:hypothetical protein